jgi:hypothetical protein
VTTARFASAAAALAVTLGLGDARAQTLPASGSGDRPAPVPVAFSADEVRLDVHAGTLHVAGHVGVDEPPFFFASGALELRRVPIGVELEGSGRLSFCRCLGSPIALRFTGATVAPPHDAIVRSPVLEIFGVPLLWLPLFWLRSTGRVGLLPPEIAWRGADGLFLGGGVHVPWAQGDRERGADLRAGGYVDGGVAVDGALRTPASATHVRWDRLRGDDGLTIDAFGTSSAAEDPSSGSLGSFAWDAHVLRGQRAVGATSDVDAAARRVDRAEAEGTLRVGSWTFASGVRAVAARGGGVFDLGAVGPVASAQTSEGLGSAGAYALTAEGGEVEEARLGGASFVRGAGRMLVAPQLGPIGSSIELTAFGNAARTTVQGNWDGAGQARGELTLPLARAFASGDAADPWIHRTAPRALVAVTATRAADILAEPPGPGALLPTGGAWLAAAGWSNAFGRLATREAAEIDLSGGAVGDEGHTLPALRAVASGGVAWAALNAEVARVFSPRPSAGGALVASARVGSASGLHLSGRVAERDGVDPILARALVDPPLEPSTRFLDAPGWTGGARAAIPIGSRVTARGGADVDFDARVLVDAGGSVEVHDPCGCVVIRAQGAHRIGRPGVDVWMSIDVPAGGR